MECDQLHQDTSIVCGQGIAFESLNQRLAVFSTGVISSGRFIVGCTHPIDNI
jgi:hypothetical protein